jgi:hypothetical protein
MGTEKMKSMNMPSAGGCRVFSEKTMWNHDPRTYGNITVCLKCGVPLVTPPQINGRID